MMINESPNEIPPSSNEVSIHSMLSDDEDTVKKKSGVGIALLNLFKSIIGAGLLSFPYAFARTGLLLSIILVTVVAILQFHTISLALNIRDVKNTHDASSKAYYKALGKNGRRFYKFLVLFVQLGICASYILIFTEFVEACFDAFGFKISRYFYGIFACLMITPTSLITNMHSLYRYSIFGLIFTYMTIFTMVGYMFNQISLEGFKKFVWADFTTIGSSIGIFIFAFESVGTNFVVKDSMEDPSKFNSLYTIALLFYYTIYITVGFAGSLSRGKKVDEVVLVGMARENNVLMIMQGFFGFNLLISYPIQMLPAMYYIEKIQMVKNAMRKYKYFRYIMRLSINITLLFVTFSIPNFAHLSNLIGSFGAGLLQFIFPVYAYHKSTSNISLRLKTFNYFCMVFGIVCAIAGTTQSFIDILK